MDDEDEQQHALARLIARFPNASPEALTEVLQRANYDADVAQQALERSSRRIEEDEPRDKGKGRPMSSATRGGDGGNRPMTSRTRQKVERADESLAQELQEKGNRIPTARRRQLEDQESEDELLARVIAIEEDEKFARKLQSDLEAGIDNPGRPYSGKRGPAPARSMEALNAFDGFSQPLAGSSQLSKSREHMSQNDLTQPSIQRRESISRTGGLQNLHKDPVGEQTDPTLARASALKGGITASANLSANLGPNDIAADSHSDTEEHALDSAIGMDREHLSLPGEHKSFEQSSISESEHQDLMLSSEDDLPQTSNARPQTSSSRRTRPESARKSAKRQPQRTTHSEPDEDEDLDFVTKMIADKTGLQFAKDSIYSAARSVDPVPAAVSTTGKNTLWPQRTDSLQKGTSYGTARKAYDGTLADDEESNDNIFPEASKTKSLPGALDQEDEEDPDGLGNEPLGSIGAQLAELFTYIDAYQPQTFELSPELKCFIPEYMPSIGDIDPMIKVDLPTRWPGDPTTAVSEKLANLGSEVLDEPSIKQSDPAVLDLRLRALHKSSSTSQLNPTKIRAIQLGGQQDGIKALNQWIQNVHSLHAQKPQDRVEFSKKMPDVEVLMSQWAEGMEEALDQGEVQVPSAEIDMSLKEYCQLACNMVDIPIHLPHTRQKRTETRAHIESLYCLLNLYSEFKNSQHFSGRQQGLAATAEPAPAGRAAAI